MQGYCDVYKWTILKRTSPEVKCLHLTSSRRKMCKPSISNMIYHKFSHGATFYTLNGKNVNVMLELMIIRDIFCSFCMKTYLLTPHLISLNQTVQMRGHNVWFRLEKEKLSSNTLSYLELCSCCYTHPK